MMKSRMSKLSGLSMLTVVFSTLAGGSSVLAQDAFIVNDQTVPVGTAQITVPVMVDTSAERHGLSFSISYDESRLNLVADGFSLAGTEIAAAQWDGGSDHVADGELTWGIVIGFTEDPGEFDEDIVLPVGNGRHVVNLIFDVIDSSAGTAVVASKRPPSPTSSTTRSRSLGSGTRRRRW